MTLLQNAIEAVDKLVAAGEVLLAEDDPSGIALNLGIYAQALVAQKALSIAKEMGDHARDSAEAA